MACRCASEAVSAYRRPVPIDIGVGANCLTIERWRRRPTHWVIICALVGTKLRRDQLVRSACRERNEPLAKARSDANSGLDGGSAIFRHFKLESATGNWNLHPLLPPPQPSVRPAAGCGMGPRPSPPATRTTAATGAHVHTCVAFGSSRCVDPVSSGGARQAWVMVRSADRMLSRPSRAPGCLARTTQGRTRPG